MIKLNAKNPPDMTCKSARGLRKSKDWTQMLEKNANLLGTLAACEKSQRALEDRPPVASREDIGECPNSTALELSQIKEVI